ncbi:beta/gamma crystallin-related protein [Massilia sp. TS11]|uniref:beta/gamma crystallin-related protein n=1 Tax=Massilia sp. TS11 TaxID=2908003 RepID=UPI001EDB9753|nr:beta/gamma crystallin-related protein [Massilia sp. TS11]MCG2585636.1 beta/gamma crystallin family protein [Massilia sp. TS11]
MLQRLAIVLGMLWLGQLAAQAGEITLYSRDHFRGREVTLREVTPNLSDLGFNDRASSLVVRSGRWEICVDAEFRGECVVFERGEYPNLERFNNQISSAREVGTGRHPGSWRRYEGRRGLVEFFAQPGLNGNSTRIVRDTPDFVQIGFNDRARSLVIEDGTWQFCVDADFRGACRTLGPGRYADLGALNGVISSARMVAPDEDRNPPPRFDPSVPLLMFQDENMRGRSVAVRGDTPDLVPLGFNDTAQSILIQQGTWEFCVDAYYRGMCRILGPGQYRSLDGSLYRAISSVRQVASSGGPGRYEGDVELFSQPDFRGARVPLKRDVRTLTEYDFNDRAFSIIVHYGTWEFCVHGDFGGQCVVYGPGRYASLGSLSGQISSLRRVN